MISALKGTPSGAVRTAVLLRNQSSVSQPFFSNHETLNQLLLQASPNHISPLTKLTLPSFVSPLSSISSPYRPPQLRRSFHSSTTFFDEASKKSEPQRTGNPESSNSESPSRDEEKDSQPKDEEGREGEKEKNVPPPPPPHGDKTPWQVFTETLRSEFKKSKEWEESTKALASSAHQFTESESVKRARAAYEAASGAASSKTSSALKSTGRAIGHGAAWTWETPVVRGLRKGVSATGKGIEKITRPVRETEAYKTAVGGVKEAIDDGSSSRYGGWVEKEERRRQRQLREENDVKSGRSRNAEKMVEDPK